jgi:hypothetical protein
MSRFRGSVRQATADVIADLLTAWGYEPERDVIAEIVEAAEGLRRATPLAQLDIV